MKHIFVKGIFTAFALAGATTAFGKASSGKISATLFDGRGNKEVLAEVQKTPRTPAPEPQAAPAAPQATTSTIADGKGRTIRTVEQKGDTTVVKDARGTVMSTRTKNADGSTTVRDGKGTVIGKDGVPAGK